MTDPSPQDVFAQLFGPAIFTVRYTPTGPAQIPDGPIPDLEGAIFALDGMACTVVAAEGEDGTLVLELVAKS